ncbi:MAG: hypothetical protein SGI74_12910 [Oligoflexia bacterium]|nr:hypothetical protein [Oligoflexia bacterium]
MAGSNEVEFIIKANTQAAENAIKNFSQNATQSFSSIEKSIAVIETIAKAAVAVLVGHELIEGLKSITEAAQKQEQAVTALNTSLKLAGDFSSEASQHFQNLAKSLEHSTGINDDVILKNVALAKAFNVSNAEAEKLVKASVQLSTVFGISLESATELLGRTFEGQLGRLNRLVPATAKLTAAQLQAGAAIDLVNSRFSGAAEAAANTYEGRLKKVGNAFEDVEKAAGRIITQNPVILRLLKLTADGFEFLEKAIINNSTAITKFISSGIISAFATLAPVIDFIRVTIGGIGTTIRGVEVALLTLPDIVIKLLFLLQKSIGALIKLPGELVEQVIHAFEILSNTVLGKKVFQKLGIDVEDFNQGLKNGIDAIHNFNNSIDTNPISQGLEKVHNGFENIVQGTKNAFITVDDKFSKISTKSKSLADSIAAVGKAQVKAANDGSAALENQIKVIETLTKAQREQVLGALSANPVGGLFGQVETPKGTTNLDKALGIASGLVQQIGQGAQGAVKLVAAAGAAVADFFLPGAGSVVGPLLELLAKGPEEVKKFVQDFAKALPQVISNIIKAAPAFGIELTRQVPNIIREFVKSIPDIINALVDDIPDLIFAIIASIPEIIGALIENIPKIIEALIKAIPRLIGRFIEAIPQIVGQFLTEFLKIPGEFLKKLIEGLAEGINHIFGGGGESGGLFGQGGFLGTGLGNGSKGVFGGGIIPGVDILPNSIPLIGSLLKGGGGGSVTLVDKNQRDAQLAALASQRQVATQPQVQSDQTLVVNLRISEKDLASTILQLNRQGFRTA